MERLVERFLAGQRNQAARRATPIEHRRRPFENVDALEEIRIYLHAAVGAVVAHGLQTVQVDVIHRAIVETTHRYVVVAVRGAIGIGQHPRGVAHGLGYGL
ncbi:hypothetical protein D3C77_322730 [compost metagenome]